MIIGLNFGGLRELHLELKFAYLGNVGYAVYP